MKIFSAKKLLAFALIGSLAANVGCTKDSTTDTNPTISGTSTGAGSTVTAGQRIAVIVTVAAGTSRKVTKVHVDEDVIGTNSFVSANVFNGGTSSDTTISTTALTFTIYYKVPTSYTGGQKTIKLTATDDNKQTGTANVVLGSSSTSKPVSFTSGVIGAQDNTNNSFYSFSNHTSLNLSDAYSNSAQVDAAFYYGTVNMATLAATNDPTIQGGAGNIEYDKDLSNGNQGVESFTTKNATKFKKATDNSKFDPTNLSYTNEQFATFYSAESSTESSKVANLKAGDVVYFHLDASKGGKYGALKVTSLSGTSSSTATIQFQGYIAQ